MAHARILTTLELLMGSMALLCGLVLAAGLGGPILGMQRAVLAGSPFDNFRVPGLILAGVVGGSQVKAAWAEWHDARWATLASSVAGSVLVGWIVGEMLLLGWIAPHGLQPFCGAYGALELGLVGRRVTNMRSVQRSRNSQPRPDIFQGRT
jgi:hypothetical protein